MRPEEVPAIDPFQAGTAKSSSACLEDPTARPTLRSALLAKLDDILLGFWLLVVLGMLLGTWHARTAMRQQRCLESLREPVTSDVVRMSLCKD